MSKKYTKHSWEKRLTSKAKLYTLPKGALNLINKKSGVIKIKCENNGAEMIR